MTIKISSFRHVDEIKKVYRHVFVKLTRHTRERAFKLSRVFVLIKVSDIFIVCKNDFWCVFETLMVLREFYCTWRQKFKEANTSHHKAASYIKSDNKLSTATKRDRVMNLMFTSLYWLLLELAFATYFWLILIKRFLIISSDKNRKVDENPLINRDFSQKLHVKLIMRSYLA